MKKVSRYFFAFLAIISVSIGMIACKESSITYITEDDIWNIMDEVEDATLDKDIDGVMKHLAPSVVINVIMYTPLGPQKTQRSREQYKKETLNLWTQMTYYDYKRENDEIKKISDDGQVAVVETDVIENYVVQGKAINTKIHERVTLEVVDGEILVTRIDAFMRM